jgi:hypothetical protein
MVMKVDAVDEGGRGDVRGRGTRAEMTYLQTRNSLQNVLEEVLRASHTPHDGHFDESDAEVEGWRSCSVEGVRRKRENLGARKEASQQIIKRAPGSWPLAAIQLQSHLLCL